jgi:hypothetical protein
MPDARQKIARPVASIEPTLDAEVRGMKTSKHYEGPKIVELVAIAKGCAAVSAIGGKADIGKPPRMSALDPKRT